MPSPETLHPRQAEFLGLDCEEALFGGAVGGGKTETLLRWLEEGVVTPGFSGLFLRRTHAQVEGSATAPIERSRRFFMPHGGIYNASKHWWTFPNGASVRFGHMQHEKDKFNYDGHEFHRICFDQIEQFSETQYQYMFSRLRRTIDYPIRCGVRSAANPHGGSWVKRRFVTQEAIDTLKGYTARDPSPPGMMFTAPCGAIFCPSRIADNPSLEVAEYIERLRSKLGATLAAQLANGDWSAVEGAVIDPNHLRYYRTRNRMIEPLARSGDGLGRIIDAQYCQRFATIDTAGTSRQLGQEDRGREPSWSVVAIWDYCPETQWLFLRHIWRRRVGWVELKDRIPEVLNAWDVRLVKLEDAHYGRPLADELMGFDVQLVKPQVAGMKTARAGDVKSAKLERAIASGFLTKLERAEFYLPEVTVVGVSEWMPEYESELLGWTGRQEEVADQIDVSSYAVHHVREKAAAWGGVISDY